jgi:hypothetical protein
VTSRTRPCDDAVTRGRLRKAEQFWEAAELTREFADDEDEVGGYSASPVSAVDRKRAQRQAERLLQAARDRSTVS